MSGRGPGAPRTPALGCVLLVALSISPAPGAQAQGTAGTSSAEFVVELVARSFFRAILDGQLAAALPLCAAEVNFDGHWARGRPAVERELTAMRVRTQRRRLRLHKIVALTAEEAVRRYGRPPARIKEAVGPGRMVALVRLGETGAAVVLRREGGLWRVIAITD